VTLNVALNFLSQIQMFTINDKNTSKKIPVNFMLSATHKQINLQFKFPAGTSRGVLVEKPSSFILIEKDGFVGVGECSIIPNLSIDPLRSYTRKLNELCKCINEGLGSYSIDLSAYPSIAFGLETALLDLASKATKQIFPSEFSNGNDGISINGLVWMGDKDFMQDQIREKIESGYRCVKLKVGAIDFETELEIIASIRKQFSDADIEIRVDANGGFGSADALEKLNRLSSFGIHSIEQPIRQGQWEQMAELCTKSPIPIVLDEELIGLTASQNEEMLEIIKPAYIILKPSLIGGFLCSEEWINRAETLGIGWWVTSALESNIGLNAIAQWTYTLGSALPQGLGTGQLFHNNITSPLVVEAAKLYYGTENEWDLKDLS